MRKQSALARQLQYIWRNKPIQNIFKKAKWVIRDKNVQPFKGE